MTLNNKEIEEAKKIVANPIGLAAFSGMIFNASLNSDLEVDQLIKNALNIRIRMQKLVE